MTKQDQKKLRDMMAAIDDHRDHLNASMADPLLWEPEAVTQHFERLKRAIENIFRKGIKSLDYNVPF